MSTTSTSHGAAMRTFVVVALSLLVFVAGGLALRRAWAPQGVFGYAVDGDTKVTYVGDGSPAARAGMQVGDIIDLRSTPLQFRHMVGLTPFTLQANQRVTFGLIHKGTRRTLALTSIPEPRGRFDAVFRVSVLVCALFFIVLGAALVLLRPSLLTWAFFIYCLSDTGFSFQTVSLLLPFPGWYISRALFHHILDVAGTVGLFVFALCFLNEPVKGWRLSALRAMPWLFAGLLGFSLFELYFLWLIGGPPGKLIGDIDFGFSTLLL